MEAETPVLPSFEPDEPSRPFFEGMARGALVIPRCGDCSSWLGPAAKLCTECSSESLTWTQASGFGTVHSFSIVHQVYLPAFRKLVPYNVAVVELAEGPRMYSVITDCDNADIVVGMEVKAVFPTVNGDSRILKFSRS